MYKGWENNAFLRQKSDFLPYFPIISNDYENQLKKPFTKIKSKICTDQMKLKYPLAKIKSKIYSDQ